jgi:hypothetical protein
LDKYFDTHLIPSLSFLTDWTSTKLCNDFSNACFSTI